MSRANKWSPEGCPGREARTPVPISRRGRIAISTLGTRGDVQPYIALALGLIEKGHAVQIAAPTQFEAMVQERGIAFAPLPGEFLDLLDKPEAKAAMAGGRGFSAGFKILKYMRPLAGKLLDAEWDAARAFKPDILVYHPKCFGAPSMAEALGRPCILASPLPGFTPTSAFPSPMVPFRTAGPFNRLTHALTRKAPDLLFGALIRQWRSAVLGLPEQAGPGCQPTTTLYAYSPQVIPAPPDWDENILVTGYWFLDSPNWTLPAPLSAFLKAGEPPVYVGFGSMPGIDPRKMTAIVIEALSRGGKRGILATGGGALDGQGVVSGNVHVITGAPHDRLFEHVSATVHHGGAGTTGAALRAGKPTVSCPFLGDQSFWGRRIAQLGVGPEPLDRRALSPAALAEVIAAMDGPAMRKRASLLGAAIREEKGVESAAACISRVLGIPDTDQAMGNCTIPLARDPCESETK